MENPATLQDTLQWVKTLTPEERQQLEASIAQSPSLALWAPNQGPQTLAYYSEADELLYGGAAGGGKSSLIVGLALTAHRRSLIIRRESTQLRGMIDDIAKILGSRSGLNKQDGQWRTASPTHPGEELLIEFGGVPNPGDEERHQGIPHDLIAFDEVTQLPEYVVDYLSTWNRTTTTGQRTRIVLASNPPTPSTLYNQTSSSGTWVIRRYAPWLDPDHPNPAAPGELRWFAVLDGKDTELTEEMGGGEGFMGMPFIYKPTGELILPKSRTFIPAKVSDNPYLMGTNYEAQLKRLTGPLREAMYEGDFTITLADRPMQLIPAQWIREANKRYNAIAASPAMLRTPLSALGVDVARGGLDNTVIAPRHANVHLPFRIIPGHMTPDGPSAAVEVLRARVNQAHVTVDANGPGGACYDHLIHNANIDQSECTAYVGSRAAPSRRDKTRKYAFPNVRSAAYWELREALDPSNPTPIAIAPDDELTTELTLLTYEEQSGNPPKLVVMPKKRHVELLGHSPDKSDALVMSRWVRTDDDDEVLLASDQSVSTVSHTPQTIGPRVSDQSRDWGTFTPDQVTRPHARRTRWTTPANALPYPRR